MDQSAAAYEVVYREAIRALDLQRSSFDRFLLRRAVREAQHRKYKLDPRLGADRTRSDLERDFLFRQWQGPELVPFTLPAVGETVTFLGRMPQMPRSRSR